MLYNYMKHIALSGLFFVLIVHSIALGSPRREILLLHSYHQNLDWTNHTTLGVEAVLDTTSIHNELHIEYMDTKRFEPESMYPIFEAMYRQKYQNTTFDVLIASDNNALDFVLARRESLFADVPLVFCGINNFNDALIAGQHDITGVVEAVEIEENIKLIQKLLPDTRKIVVINDRTPTGAANQNRFHEAARSFAGRFEFIELVSVSTDSLTRVLNQLPDDTAPLVFTFHVDEAGNRYSIDEYLTLIHENTRRPVFSFWEHYLGKNVIGGIVVNGESQGQHAAEMALKILSGQPADSITIMRHSPNVPMFDYTELKEFKIDLSRLPANSILIHKPDSFYSKYKTEIWLVIFAFCFLVGSVITLLLNTIRRSKAEAALRESREKYQLLTDNIEEVFWIVSPDWGKIFYVSPAYETIWGRTPQSLYENPMSWLDAVIEDDRQKIATFFESFVDTDWTRIEFPEYRLQINDTIKWIQARGFAVKNDSGKIEYVTGIAIEITRQKQAEQALRASETKFRSITEQMSDVVYITDREGQITFISDAVRQVFGYEPAEMQGQPFTRFLFEDQIPKALRHFRGAVLHGEPTLHLSLKMKTKDGSAFWGELNGSIYKRNGVSGTIGLIRDVSERMQAENSLKESEAKFRSLFENINAAVALHEIITDENNTPVDFIFLDANPAYENLTKLKVSEIVGKRGTDVIPNLEQKWIEAYGKVAQTGESVTIIDHSTYLDKYWEVKAYAPRQNQFAVVLSDITERLKAEKNLRRERDRAQKYLDIAGVIFVALNENGDVTLINQKGSQILGYESDKIIGKNWFASFLPASIQDQVKAVFGKLMRGDTKSGEHHENSVLTKDGEERTIAWYNTLIHDEQGKISGILSSGEDVTERRRAEKALLESEQKFRSYVHNAPTGIFIADEKGNYIGANPAAEMITGYSRQELLQMNMIALIPPEERDKALQHFNTVVTRGKASGDLSFVKKDGSLRFWRVDAVSLSDTRFLGFVTDITNRRRMEEELERNNRLMSTLLDNLQVGVFMVDAPTGKPLLANKKAMELLGRGIMPEAKTGTLAEIYEAYRASTDEQYPTDQMPIVRGLLGEQTAIDDMEVLRPDGTRVLLEVQGIPVRNNEGQIIASLVSFADITERKRFEVQLKQTLAEKTTLLQELYHRTKNNMQVISAMLAMKSEFVQNPEVVQIFREMENRIQSMALVHQKLYQSQSLSRINLKEYTHELTTLLIRSYSTSMRVNYDIDAENLFVLIDTAMPCGLILNELISNALKYAFPNDRAGTIRISVHRLDTNHIEIVVADDGVGLPAGIDLRNSETLGLQTVFILAEKQLDGSIEFKENNGLTCRLVVRDDLYEERHSTVKSGK